MLFHRGHDQVRLDTKRDGALLERELTDHHYTHLLHELQQREPILHRFPTWLDLVKWARLERRDSPMLDSILRVIIEQYREDRDERWQSILLAIFWPALERIHKLKRGWDREVDRRWSNLTLAFIKVITRFDIQMRPERIAQKILNDCSHDLYLACKANWKQDKRERAIEEGKLDVLVGGSEDVGVAGFELEDELKMRVWKLQALKAAGRINEVDYQILLGTRIYGGRLREVARGVGMSYEAAKKRGQRAEAAVRRCERRL